MTEQRKFQWIAGIVGLVAGIGVALMISHWYPDWGWLGGLIVWGAVTEGFWPDVHQGEEDD